MKNLTEAIKNLIAELEPGVIDENSLEARAVVHLTHLQNALKNSEHGRTDILVVGLRQFWLKQVPWCSRLSRSLEKIMIQYDEVENRICDTDLSMDGS